MAPNIAYSPAETAQRIPYDALCRAIADILLKKRRGLATAPERMVVPLAKGGVLLIMPATDGTLAVTKIVTVHPENPAAGLPLIQGEVIVMDARTGERLAVLDGITVTARRTAAVSALAARHLAPFPTGPLLVFGAGVQARSHIQAFREVLGVSEVMIASRTRSTALAARDFAQSLGMAASVVDETDAAVRRAPLIVTATTSPKPVFPDHVRSDAFVAAVGVFQPDRAELPAELVRRARLYVDTREGAESEAGDLIQAGVDWAAVTPLASVLAGERLPEPCAPVVFKSVGHALFDLAAAVVAVAG